MNNKEPISISISTVEEEQEKVVYEMLFMFSGNLFKFPVLYLCQVRLFRGERSRERKVLTGVTQQS